jgi:DNA-binding NtrC family response regulator
VIAAGEWITEQDLPERVRAARLSEMVEHPEPAYADGDPLLGGPDEGNALRSRLLRYEAKVIAEALRDAGWNQTAAAHALGMPLRTLVHKIKALGITKLGYAAR